MNGPTRPRLFRRRRALTAGGVVVWVAGTLAGPALHTAFHDRPHEHTAVGIHFSTGADVEPAHRHEHPHEHPHSQALEASPGAFHRHPHVVDNAPFAHGHAPAPDRHSHVDREHGHDSGERSPAPESDSPFHGATSIAHFASFIAAHPAAIACLLPSWKQEGPVTVPVVEPSLGPVAPRSRSRAPPLVPSPAHDMRQAA